MNVRRFANSLVTRLIFFGVLMVSFGVAVRYVMIPTFLHRSLVEVVSQQQSALARAVAGDIGYRIGERRRTLERLASHLPRPLLLQPRRLQQWLQALHDSHAPFSPGFAVADADGRILARVPASTGLARLSVADSWIAAASHGRSALGRPAIDPANGQPVLPMAAPIDTGAGTRPALLIGEAALAAPGCLAFLQQPRIGGSGRLFLDSPRGRWLITASGGAMLLKPLPHNSIAALYRRAADGLRASGETVDAQGVEEISAVAAVPNTDWFVVASVPMDTAMAALDQIRASIIHYGVLAIAMVLVFAGVLVTWMLRPLYRAADRAERMSRDELPLEPLPIVRDDEVGHLTAAFNRLLEKLTKSRAELEHVAHHDTLTGLPNRGLLTDRMELALARSQRNHSRLALLFLDLDDFKLINDALGHEAGDEALKEVARRLQAALRHSDTLARFGGDEFVLLATDLEEKAEDGARTLATKCIEAIEQPLELRGKVFTLGVSIGITLCGGSCTLDQVLVAADTAMYEAKQMDGSRYVMAPLCADLRGAGAPS